MMLRPAVVPLSLALLLIGASASAAPRPRAVGVRLEYQRGPRTQQCPDTKDFRAEVAAWLGRDPFTEAGPWRLIANINRRRDGAYIATAELFDDQGASVRSLEPMAGKDCRYLLKMVLAERIAAELADAPPPPPVPSPPPPPPPLNVDVSTPATSSSQLPPPQLSSPPALRWWVGGATGAEAGVLPTWVPTLSLNIGVRSKVVSLAFEAQVGLPLNGTAESGMVVHASSGTGSLVGCFRGIFDGILFLCTVTTAGVFVGGPERDGTADTLGSFVAGGIRGGVEVPGPSKQFALYLEGDLLYTFNPVTMMQNAQLVWRSEDATDIAAGSRATCAVLESGELRCWGFHAGRAPQPVPLLGKARDVALGWDSIVVEVETRPGGYDLYGGSLRWRDRLFAFTSGSRPRQIENVFICARSILSPAPACWAGSTTIPAPEGATDVDEDGCFVGPQGRACPREATIGLDGFSDTPPPWRRHFETRPPLVGVGHYSGRDEDLACGGQADGRIECHGVPDEGQLGDGKLSEPTAPALVPGLADVAQIRLSSDVYKDQPLACARTRGGAASCWIIGESDPVPLPVSDVVDLTVNPVRVVALRRDGSVVEIPIEVRGTSLIASAPEAAIKGPLARRRYVALVDDTVAGAITSDGSLIQIHCPASPNSCASMLDTKSVRARAAGWDMNRVFACAIDERGAVQCRATSTEVGILGDGRGIAKGSWDSPKKLKFTLIEGTAALPGPAVQLVASETHVCARTQAGELRCWGDERRCSPPEEPREGPHAVERDARGAGRARKDHRCSGER